MHDVYRLPGRENEPGFIPPPSALRLLSPLGWGLGVLTALVVPLVVLNACYMWWPAEPTHFVPWVDDAQDVAMVLLLGTFGVTVAVLVRRVVPIWRGLGPWSRAAYVAGILLTHGIGVVGAEAAAFTSRGGLHLFEPTLVGASSLANGRTAYVYEAGIFSARYELWLAERGSIVMHRARSRNPEDVVPTVHFRPDGRLELLDAAGRTMATVSTRESLGGGR